MFYICTSVFFKFLHDTMDRKHQTFMFKHSGRKTIVNYKEIPVCARVYSANEVIKITQNDIRRSHFIDIYPVEFSLTYMFV